MSALPLAVTHASPAERTRLVRRSSRLTALTVAYNLLEGVISLVAGALAGSVVWGASGSGLTGMAPHPAASRRAVR